jgi:tetratricopeptide (TPR) repeat protein
MVTYVRALDGMHAVMGTATDTQVLKRLIANGFPVIVETWFVPEPDDEMGHYRMVIGYDDATRQYTTQDVYTGPGRSLPYADLETHWKVFNRVYVVVYEAHRQSELAQLLGSDLDREAMYRRALAIALSETDANPDDGYAWFNAGTNYLGLGLFQEAVEAYDRARMLKLPYRMLWYQFGPFEAYLHIGRYQDVIDLANANLKTAGNLEESFYYRALARRALGDDAGAREDLQRALHLNPLYSAAAAALGE